MTKAKLEKTAIDVHSNDGDLVHYRQYFPGRVGFQRIDLPRPRNMSRKAFRRMFPIGIRIMYVRCLDA